MNKKFIVTISILVAVVYGFMLISPNNVAYGQQTVECGDTIASEFGQEGEVHEYSLQMSVGDSFEVSVQPVGEYLSTAIGVYGPRDDLLEYTVDVRKEPVASSDILSSSGIYTVIVANARIDKYGVQKNYKGGFGHYRLLIKCIIGGIPIGPGDNNSGWQTPSSNLVVPSFLQVGANYQITADSRTYLVKVVEIADDGWVKVEQNASITWLNFGEVLFVTPVQ